MSRISVGLLVALMMGCDSHPAPSPPPDDQGPTYSVVPDPAALGIDPSTHVAGSRKADEEAALARLRTLYPEAVRALAEADSIGGGVYAVDGNEEAARLLSIIYAIRNADGEAERREKLQDLSRRLRFEKREEEP
ncbi:MAG: hypothetical protein ACRDHF_08200 [Tepidiformaceae bacterium]